MTSVAFDTASTFDVSVIDGGSLWTS